jgi:hypothetical protein
VIKLKNILAESHTIKHKLYEDDDRDNTGYPDRTETPPPPNQELRPGGIKDEPFDDSGKYAQFGDPNTTLTAVKAYEIYNQVKDIAEIQSTPGDVITLNYARKSHPALTSLEVIFPSLEGEIGKGYQFVFDSEPTSRQSHKLYIQDQPGWKGRESNYYKMPGEWYRNIDRSIQNTKSKSGRGNITLDRFFELLKTNKPTVKWVSRNDNWYGSIPGDQESYTIQQYNGSINKITSNDPVGRYSYRNLQDLYNYILTGDESLRTLHNAHSGRL